MLPRPVVVGIVILLTLMEALNLFAEVFLGTGADAFHIVYPTVLAALGFTSAGKVAAFPKEAFSHHDDEGDETDDKGDADDVEPDTDPAWPSPAASPRHRSPPRGRDR